MRKPQPTALGLFCSGLSRSRIWLCASAALAPDLIEETAELGEDQSDFRHRATARFPARAGFQVFQLADQVFSAQGSAVGFHRARDCRHSIQVSARSALTHFTAGFARRMDGLIHDPDEILRAYRSGEPIQGTSVHAKSLRCRSHPDDLPSQTVWRL